MSLIFLEKYQGDRVAFEAKVRDVSTRLGIDPNWLMAVMNSESGVNPHIKNPNGSASGLIQFIESTANGLGTTTAALRAMDGVQQLDYVYKFYAPYKSKLNSYADLYLITFYPAAAGKPSSYIIGSTPAQQREIARVNPAMDPTGKGYITKADFEQFAFSRVPEQYWAQVGSISGKKKTAIAGTNFILLLIGLGAFLALQK